MVPTWTWVLGGSRVLTPSPLLPLRCCHQDEASPAQSVLWAAKPTPVHSDLTWVSEWPGSGPRVLAPEGPGSTEGSGRAFLFPASWHPQLEMRIRVAPVTGLEEEGGAVRGCGREATDILRHWAPGSQVRGRSGMGGVGKEGAQWRQRARRAWRRGEPPEAEKRTVTDSKGSDGMGCIHTQALRARTVGGRALLCPGSPRGQTPPLLRREPPAEGGGS